MYISCVVSVDMYVGKLLECVCVFSEFRKAFIEATCVGEVFCFIQPL